MEHRNSTVMTSSGSIRSDRAAICSTRSRTSSSTAGTSSASVRGRSSRSTSSARTCPASCGWPKASRSTTARSSLQPRRLADLRVDRATRSADLIEAVARRARARGAVGRRDEPDGAVHRRRPHDRSDELADTVHFVLPVRRRDRARARSDAARALRRPRHARRLHARDVAGARQAGRRARRLRRSSVHDRRRGSGVSPRSAATRRSRSEFFARYIQGREVADYARAARARGSRRCASAIPGARGGATCGSSHAHGCARRRASAADTRRLTRPGSTRTTSCGSWTARGLPVARRCGRGAARHKPGDTIAVAFVDRTGVAKTAKVDARRGSACSSSCRSNRRPAR